VTPLAVQVESEKQPNGFARRELRPRDRPGTGDALNLPGRAARLGWASRAKNMGLRIAGDDRRPRVAKAAPIRSTHASGSPPVCRRHEGGAGRAAHQLRRPVRRFLEVQAAEGVALRAEDGAGLDLLRNEPMVGDLVLAVGSSGMPRSLPRGSTSITTTTEISVGRKTISRVRYACHAPSGRRHGLAPAKVVAEPTTALKLLHPLDSQVARTCELLVAHAVPPVGSV
jgi:hypothetical protein